MEEICLKNILRLPPQQEGTRKGTSRQPAGRSGHLAGQHTEQLAGRTAGEAFGDAAHSDNCRVRSIRIQHPADVQRIIQLCVIIEAKHNLAVDQAERFIAGEPDAGSRLTVIVKLRAWHLREHLAEIIQHTGFNLTVIDNQQLDRDIFQLGLSADGFNAQLKITDPVARRNNYGHIMHDAAPSGTIDPSAF
ncbi:hypothetical protein D3C73_1174850 [compost metagenome]